MSHQCSVITAGFALTASSVYEPMLFVINRTPRGLRRSAFSPIITSSFRAFSKYAAEDEPDLKPLGRRAKISALIRRILPELDDRRNISIEARIAVAPRRSTEETDLHAAVWVWPPRHF